MPSQSIFMRKKPLQPATIRRILEGLRRFSGPALQPFLVQLTHGGRVRDIDAPIPTVTMAHRGEIGVAEPFVVPFRSDNDGRVPRVKDINEPLHTITTENPIGLAEPFLVPLYSERDGQRPRIHSVDDPVPVIPASGDGKFGIVEPFVLSQGGGGVPRSVSEPAPTIVTDGAMALVEPFIVTPGGADLRAGRSTSEPLPTVMTYDRMALVEPFLSVARNNNTPKGLDEPVPSLCTGGHVALVEPLIAKYNRTAKVPKPVSEPLDTVSTRDRFALVQPVVNGYTLDIKFRMLQPAELAAAMSFPKDYAFAGTKGDTIRQIGNAVDCRMAEALCGAILDAKRPSSTTAEAVA